MANRQCGECTVCCVVLPITEFGGKPRNVPCEKLCASGCSIHNLPEHPQVCRDYRCEWLEGNVQEDYRPDKLGVVFWIGDPDTFGGVLKTVLRVNETRPRAITEQQSRIDSIVRRIKQRYYPRVSVIEVVYYAYDLEGPGLPNDGYRRVPIEIDGRLWMQHIKRDVAHS